MLCRHVKKIVLSGFVTLKYHYRPQKLSIVGALVCAGRNTSICINGYLHGLTFTHLALTLLSFIYPPLWLCAVQTF